MAASLAWQLAEADQRLLCTADVCDAHLSALLHETTAIAHEVGDELDRKAALAGEIRPARSDRH